VTQNFEPLIPEIGGTLCSYLARQSQIHRKHFKACSEPNCFWSNWHHSSKTAQVLTNSSVNSSSVAGSLTSLPLSKRRDRVVLSYAHNGFGNQLWQHTVAFMIAESLRARLYIAAIPDQLAPNGVSPPNTWAGVNAMQKLLPTSFNYEILAMNASDKRLCDAESFFISDRPIDWRSKNYTSHFKSNLYELLRDNNPRCLKTLGYFQNYPICSEDLKRLWTPRMFSNFSMRPARDDISIYLRCMPRHYHFNERR